MNDFFAYWVHDINPFAIQFPQGWVFPGIRWYGLAYILGFFCAILLLKHYDTKGKIQLDSNMRWSLVTYLIIGVLLGGKGGYWILYDPLFWTAPLQLLQNFNGQIAGMSSHGGFIGATIALWLFCRRYKTDFWKLSDALMTAAPPGIFFGRIANFINGELWGKVTTASWGIIFPRSAPYEGYPLSWLLPRHPSQLYAAVLEGLLLGIYLQWRFWRTETRPGVIAFEGLMAYALLRIIGEQFREPDASLLLGMSRGIFYSLLVFLMALLGRFYRQTTLSLKNK